MATRTTTGTTPGLDEGRVRLVKGLAAAVGALFLLIGIVGFFVTGFDSFAEHTDETLLGFEINPLHNLVHIAVGVAGLALSRRLERARVFGWLLVAGYGLTFLYGLFAVDRPEANILSINWADNWLHLASVLIGLVIALLPVRHTRGAARR